MLSSNAPGRAVVLMAWLCCERSFECVEGFAIFLDENCLDGRDARACCESFADVVEPIEGDANGGVGEFFVVGSPGAGEAIDVGERPV